MKKNIRKVTAVLLGLLGTILAIYVGGYWLFIRPVRFLYVGFMAGGGIWCIFDIIAGHFRDE